LVRYFPGLISIAHYNTTDHRQLTTDSPFQTSRLFALCRKQALTYADRGSTRICAIECPLAGNLQEVRTACGSGRASGKITACAGDLCCAESARGDDSDSLSEV
jgi:hypothetical protein